MAKNKTLTSEVDRLRSELEKVNNEKTAQDEQMSDLSRQITEKNKERLGMTMFLEINHVI